MNMIAIDIGNTSITARLYLNDEEKLIETIRAREDARHSPTCSPTPGRRPLRRRGFATRRNGVIVASSVNPAWTDIVADICRNCLNEKLKVIGKDVPLPIDTAVDNAMEVGTDRLVAAAAAFAVVEDAVVVADFGTAVTIDLVDENGTFMAA